MRRTEKLSTVSHFSFQISNRWFSYYTVMIIPHCCFVNKRTFPRHELSLVKNDSRRLTSETSVLSIEIFRSKRNLLYSCNLLLSPSGEEPYHPTNIVSCTPVSLDNLQTHNRRADGTQFVRNPCNRIPSSNRQLIIYAAIWRYLHVRGIQLLSIIEISQYR